MRSAVIGNFSFGLLSDAKASANAIIQIPNNEYNSELNPKLEHEINSIRLKEQASAPDTPASGYFQVYAKNDGKLYCKNDAGTEISAGDLLTVLRYYTGLEDPHTRSTDKPIRHDLDLIETDHGFEFWSQHYGKVEIVRGV